MCAKLKKSEYTKKVYINIKRQLKKMLNRDMMKMEKIIMR